MDNIITDSNVHTSKNFDYFDPYITSYAYHTDTKFNNPTQNISSPLKITNFSRHNLYDVHTSIPSNLKFDHNLRNIGIFDADNINNISIKIYNEISTRTQSNFCIFPIGIMATFIENDVNLNKILSSIKTSDFFHQIKIQKENTIVSRASIKLSLNTSQISKKILSYEDNDNIIIEFPIVNTSLAIGIMCCKNGDNINLSHKLFSVYTKQLKIANLNVYCPAFKVMNKLHLDELLISMGYINNSDLHYLQTIYFEMCNNLYIKKTSTRVPIDLSDNFIFYTRIIPNNIILSIGRYGMH